MSEAPESVLSQIQKLLNLASKNTSEEEAASAMSKAQELLTKWNLTFEAVAGAQVGSGARQKEAVEGGFHLYERDLWKSVAHLNFCLYWHQTYYNREKLKNKYGEVRIWMHRHSLVGRKVNVAATQAMASYLSQEVTRLTKERTRGLNSQYSLSNWANSYRRGIVARVCERLYVERSKLLAEEKERASAAKRATSGASTSTALVLHTYIDREMDANIDFEWGEGTAAAMASKRAAKAALDRGDMGAYTQWAAANPKEARKLEKERKSKKSDRSSDDSNIDDGAYWVGYDEGDGVSIHRQMDETKISGEIGHG